MATSNRKYLLIILIALVIMGVSSFLYLRTQAKPSEHAESVTLVGAIIPLTGEVATYGESLQKGFDLAAAEFGGKVKVIYEDSKANPKDGVTAMQKLLGQGVKHFLGDATSGVSLAIAPLADKNKALMMISIATSDDLSKAGPFVYRNCPPNRKQAEAAADFIKETLKATKVAVLFKANPYGANLAGQFRKDAASRGLDIVFDDQYEDSLHDFSTLVQKLKKAKPQAVFIPGNYEETALLLRKARELNFNSPFIGTDGAYSPKLIELAGEAAEGFYLTMLGVDKNAAFYKTFVSAYSAKYHAEPDVFTAYGYEGAMILFQAATAGGSIADQQNRLSHETWDGLLGKASFDADGEIVRKVQILKVHSSGFGAALE